MLLTMVFFGPWQPWGVEAQSAHRYSLFYISRSINNIHIDVGDVPIVSQEYGLYIDLKKPDVTIKKVATHTRIKLNEISDKHAKIRLRDS